MCFHWRQHVLCRSSSASCVGGKESARAIAGFCFVHNDIRHDINWIKCVDDILAVLLEYCQSCIIPLVGSLSMNLCPLNIGLTRPEPLSCLIGWTVTRACLVFFAHVRPSQCLRWRMTIGWWANLITHAMRQLWTRRNGTHQNNTLNKYMCA